MSDFMDFLSGLSGVGAGLAKGATLGMEPFAAWEKVRSADLANDRSDVQLRDLYGVQDEREASGDYYQNLVGAANSGYRKTSAGNERDIFGLEQQLAMQQYLSDPNDAFQQGLAETGWTPGTPEYRAWLAEAMGQFDPSAAVGAYDKMGIPRMQQRNVDEQAVLATLEQLIQRDDPGATVQRGPDGQVYVIGSDGTSKRVSGDALVRVASMLGDPKGPDNAITQGLLNQQRLVTGNVQNQKTLSGLQNDTPSKRALDGVKNQLTQLRAEGQQAVSVLNKLRDNQRQSSDPESYAGPIVEAEQRLATINKQGQQLWQTQQYLMQQSMGGGGGMGPPRSAMNPQGGSSVNTKTPGSGASRAAGAARRQGGATGSWDTPPDSYGMPTRDTGIRPIGGQ